MPDTDLLDFELAIEGLDLPDVRVLRVTGREALSRPYAFEVRATVAAELDPASVIGRGATLSFVREGSVVRQVHGLVAESEEVFEVQGAHYVFRLAPRLFRSSLVETLDIFMEMTLREILTAVLGRAGLTAEGKDADVVFRLEGKYPKLEFVVQYKETDLAFVSRLTENAGVAFFFEQGPRGDVLVFSDSNAAFAKTPGMPAATFQQRHDWQRGLFTLASRSKVTPSKYVMRDYNYRNPKLDLTAEAAASTGNGGAVVEYGAHFRTPDEGKALALVRAEERIAAQSTRVGTGVLEALVPGATFKVEGLPREELDLLVVSVEHDYDTRRGEDLPRGGSTTFTAIETKTTFRPARTTPKPRIGGVITGFVEADPSDDKYAKVDDQGRYTVRFVFDVTGPEGATASQPIRMAQPHAGPGYGFHFPLRGGVEVLVSFLDGDPDRPIISSTVPNPTTPSPVDQSNSARNVIRTGSGNEINLDDTKGSERIKLSSPHDGATIQLGSPNSPESGIAISSLTNATTATALTGNTASSLQSSVSLFASGWGNHNYNVAGLNNDYALVSLGVSELSNALKFSQSICDDITAVNTALYTTKQNAANEAWNTYDGSDTALASAAPTNVPDCCWPPVPAGVTQSPGAYWPAKLAADQSAYDAAQAAVIAGEGQLATDLGNQSTPQSGTTYPGTGGDRTVQNDWAKLGNANDDKFGQAGDPRTPYTLTGQDAAGNPTPYYQARYNAKLQLDLDMKAVTGYSPPATCTGCGASKATLASAYASYTSDRTANESAQKEAIDNNPADPRCGAYATNASAGNASAGIADADSLLNTVSGVALPIWSTYMTVTGAGMMAYAAGGCDLLRRDALGQFDGSKQLTWGDPAPLKGLGKLTGAGSTKITEAPVAPHPVGTGRISRLDWGGGTTSNPLTPGIAGMQQVLGAPLTPLFWKTPFFKEARQLLGSDEHAYFWGRTVAFVGGQEAAVLSSRDKAIVTGGKSAVLHARGQAEVAGGDLVDITSAKCVDVASRGTINVAVTVDTPPTAVVDPATGVTPTVPAQALSSIALTGKSAAHTVEAAASDGTITWTVKDAANPLSVTMTQTSKTIVVDGGDTGTITLQAGGWKLELSPTGIVLSKGGTSVNLADAQLTAQAGTSKLTLGTNASLENAPSSLTLAAMSAKLANGGGSVQVMATGVQAGPMFNGG